LQVFLLQPRCQPFINLQLVTFKPDKLKKMAEAVEMPKLSDTMEEGVLVGWQVDEGDEVEMGQVIAQVETDKATRDLEAYEDGVLLKKVIDEGEAVPIGQLIAVIGEEGEDVSEIVGENGEADAGTEAEASDDEADDEDEDESEDVETQRAASDEDTDADEDAEAQDEVPQDKETADAASGGPSGNGRLRASPLARRMASENELDLGSIDGSGPQGRVVKRDVEAVLAGEKEAAPAKEREATPAAQPPGGDGYERPAEVMPAEEEMYQTEDISQMRKAIARRLGQSKFTAPHFYLTVDVDMAKAVSFRQELNELTEEQERAKISVNDLITKACAQALKEHPYVNGSYLEEEGELRLYNDVHVGVAVAIDEGLVTPVIRNVDRKGLGQIAGETREKAERARNRDLAPDEMEGSTFTTSNLGMFGIEDFTAIVNPPNACILAIGEVRETPVVEEGELAVGTRMKMTLSCDHRIVDGATGAQFLATVREYLEEPMSLML
jgi:pyruvate dehydrogenase E2 component (dihydrolipoamide acetyltransferase)